MKYLVVAVAALFFLTNLRSQPAMTEDAKLAALFKEFLEKSFQFSPLAATRAGDHRFDHLLDDVSPQARAVQVKWLKDTLAALPGKIDRKKLKRNSQIDLEIWEHYLRREVWLAENTRPYEDDPRVYNELITDSVYQLLTQSTLPAADNLKNCLERMKQIPKVLDAARKSIQSPPKVVVETAIRQNRGAIAFYEFGLFELAGETPLLSSLKDEAKKVAAGLREYQKFLQEEVFPRATGDWRLGKDKFAQKLELELDSGIGAEEVLKEAETEAVRVENEMFVIARQLWPQVFPRKTALPDDEKGRRETIRQVLDEISKEHGKVDHLVKDARATAERIKKFIKDKDILRLPDPDRCQIIEMPEFQRGNSIAFLNPAPPLDPKASSIYAISPPPRDWNEERVTSYLREYNQHILQILTIHEAYPGHYVQLEYANRTPSLIRKLLFSGVFAEGWAVYTESVLLDEGYGQGDLKLRLSQLKWYLRAVTNAILDYRMHCTNMTDQEALFLLVMRAFQSEAEAILKIIRAKQSSCQLSTYFVGRLAFHRLRRRIQNELGERFELGRFHEAVLDHGSLPVKYLPEVVPERLKMPR